MKCEICQVPAADLGRAPATVNGWRTCGQMSCAHQAMQREPGPHDEAGR